MMVDFEGESKKNNNDLVRREIYFLLAQKGVL